MKLKPTPLLLVSIALALTGLYWFFSGRTGNLGPLFGMLITFAGMLCLGLYFVSGAVFKNRIWQRVIVEILLIAGVVFFIYRMIDMVALHLPPNFKGYVFIVNGVENKPKLKSRSLFNANLHVNLSASGILFTSNEFTYPVFLVDNNNKKLYPGYDAAYSVDTLYCNNRKYIVQVLAVNFPQGWTYKADTLNRNRKKNQACELLKSARP